MAPVRGGWMGTLRERAAAVPTPGPVARLALLACGAALLFLRRPSGLVHPELWGEEGAVFFADAWNRGPLAAMFETGSGFLHVFYRAVAALALFPPLEWLPWVFLAFALLAQLLPAACLLSERARHACGPFAVRLAAAFLLLALPNSYETYLNFTNAQLHLALAVGLVILIDPPRGRAAAAAEVALLALFALNGPYCILLLPIALLALRGRAARGERRWGLTIAGALAAGTLAQVAALLSSARLARTAGTGLLSLAPGDLLRAASLNLAVKPLLGTGGATLAAAHLPLPVALAALAFAGFLAVAAIRSRSAPLLALGALGAAALALGLAFPVEDLGFLADPAASVRYLLFPTLFLCLAALRLAVGRGAAAWAGRAALAALLCVGIPLDFSQIELTDTRFPDQVAVFKTLPRGMAFSFPLNPPDWYMTLESRGPGGGPSPLAGVEPTGTTALSRLDTSFRPQPPPVRGVLLVSGYAADLPQRRPAGGVYVVVDGTRLYPAALGFPLDPTPGFFKGWPATNLGYARRIPFPELGPGTHRISLLVLSADRRRLFAPAGEKTVVIPR